MFIADTPAALARAERTLPARGALRPVNCPARREHKQPHASHRARRQKKSTTVRAPRVLEAGGALPRHRAGSCCTGLQWRC